MIATLNYCKSISNIQLQAACPLIYSKSLIVNWQDKEYIFLLFLLSGMRHLKAMCHRGVGNNNLLYCLICKGCNDCCLSLHGWTNCLDHAMAAHFYFWLLLTTTTSSTTAGALPTAKSVKALEQLTKVTCAVVHGPSSLPIQPQSTTGPTFSQGEQHQPTVLLQQLVTTSSIQFILGIQHTDVRTELVRPDMQWPSCLCVQCMYVCVRIHPFRSIHAGTDAPLTIQWGFSRVSMACGLRGSPLTLHIQSQHSPCSFIIHQCGWWMDARQGCWCSHTSRTKLD